MLVIMMSILSFISPSQDDSIDSSFKTYVVKKHAYTFTLESSWRTLDVTAQDGAHIVSVQRGSTGEMIFIVSIPEIQTEDLDEFAASRMLMHSGALQTEDSSVEPIRMECGDIEGREVCVRSEKTRLAVIERVFIHKGTGMILQGRIPLSADRSGIDTLFESFSFDLVDTEEAIVLDDFDDSPADEDTPKAIERSPLPELRVTRGSSGTIIIIRELDSFLDNIRRFALALPWANVDGVPVCFFVKDSLASAQIDLLNRLPVQDIIMVGDPLKELEPFITLNVAEVDELIGESSHVVLSSVHIGDLLEAAPYAFAMGLPLVAPKPQDLEETLSELGAERLTVFRSHLDVLIQNDFPLTDLSDPKERWCETHARTPESSYLAIANIGGGRTYASGSLLGASLLAARHGGMLRIINESSEFHYTTLTKNSDDDSEFLGTFTLPEGELSVSVPNLGPLIGLAAVEKFGDPLYDFDGDGEFTEDEIVFPGDVRDFHGTQYSLSLRCIGAIGTTKFVDALQTNRAVALSHPAESIAPRIFEIFEGEPLPHSLLLAGDHREIPHDYVKDLVYADTTMHEQELSTDNIYGDVDEDGYLDIGVGRFVSSGLSVATTTASRMSAYNQLNGDWRNKACLIYPVWPDDEIKMQIPIVFASFEAFMHGVSTDLERGMFEIRNHVRDQGDLHLTYPDLSGNSLIVFAHHAGPTSWMFRLKGRGPGGVQLLYAARSNDASNLRANCAALPPLDGAPIVLSLGCDSGGLDYEVTWKSSIVHSFFEEGAVGYLGNTRAGFPDTEEHLFRRVIQELIGSTPGVERPQTLGEAFRQGKNYLGFLISNRGPFTSTPPFEEYGNAMKREWHSLICYGDPGLRLKNETEGSTTGIKVSRENSENALRIRVQWKGDIDSSPIWIMEQVALGPLREIVNVTAPGLGYGSVPWATYHDSSKPGPVLPGVFLDIAIPDEFASKSLSIKVEKGPDWCLGAFAFKDCHGSKRAQIAVDLIRYAMSDASNLELATDITLLIE